MDVVYAKVLKMYRCSPLNHFYALYDLVHYSDKTVIEFYDNYGYVLALVYDETVWGNVVCYLHVNCVCSSDFLVKVFRKVLSKSEEDISRIFVTSIVNIEDFLERICEIFDFRVGSSFNYITMVLRKLSSFDSKQGTVVKLASLQDAYYVAELFKLWIGKKPPIERILEKFRREDWYGVKVNDKIVSMCCVYLKTPDVWVIGNVFTHPDYRGRGLAKTLLSHVCKLAIDANAVPVLHVLSNNPMFNIVLKTYEKVGFTIYEVRFGYELVPNSEQ